MAEDIPGGDESENANDRQPGGDTSATASTQASPELTLAELYERHLNAFYIEMAGAVTLLADLPLPPRQASQKSQLLDKLSTSSATPAPPELMELGTFLGNIISGVEGKDLDPDGATTLMLIRERFGKINRHLAELQTIRIRQQAEQQRLSQENAQKAERKLEDLFAQDYRRERRSAALLRALAFVLIFVTVVVAVWIASMARTLNWQGEVAHLAITLPLLGGAYYASYESRDHRRYARNGLGWHTRMNSFDDFCSPLPDEQRNDVRTAFAKRLYSDPPDFGSSKTLADASQKALDQALAIIRALRNGEPAGS